MKMRWQGSHVRFQFRSMAFNLNGVASAAHNVMGGIGGGEFSRTASRCGEDAGSDVICCHVRCLVPFRGCYDESQGQQHLANASLLWEFERGGVFSQAQMAPEPPEPVLFRSLNPTQGMITELAVMEA